MARLTFGQAYWEYSALPELMLLNLWNLTLLLMSLLEVPCHMSHVAQASLEMWMLGPFLPKTAK